MKQILFVCTGNTCRSIMAKGIFEALVSQESSLSGKYTADSAGLSAHNGDPASINSITVLNEEWDIDISSHRSKRLDEDHLKKTDLVLTMTRSHKDFILLHFPWMKSKVFTLKEFVSDCELDESIREYDYSLDILDPYGMPVHIYKLCAKELKNSLEKLVKML